MTTLNPNSGAVTADAFSNAVAEGGDTAHQARMAIAHWMVEELPDLKAAVTADCAALAKAAIEQNGQAEINDLTRAGYNHRFALHMGEAIKTANAERV